MAGGNHRTGRQILPAMSHFYLCLCVVLVFVYFYLCVRVFFLETEVFAIFSNRSIFILLINKYISFHDMSYRQRNFTINFALTVAIFHN